MADYAGIKITGAAAFDRVGTTVSSAGDINGDGIDDIMIATPNADNEGFGSSGAVYVVYGSDEPVTEINVGDLDGTNGFKITSAGATDSDGNGLGFGFGQTGAASLGDINGDGFDDIIIGGRTRTTGGYYGGEPATSTTTSFVVLGNDTGFDANVTVADLDGTNGFTIEGPNGVVNNVGSAGDINGDGLGDIFINQSPVPETSGFGGYGQYDAFRTDAIIAGDGPVAALLATDGAYSGYVIFGENNLGSTGNFDVNNLDGTNGFGVQTEVGEIGGNFEVPFYDQQIGGGLTGIGDVNGDGFDDLFVNNVIGNGIQGGGYGQNDYVINQYIVFGSNTAYPDALDPDGADSRVLAVDYDLPQFDKAYDGPNYAIAGVGDINGDGFDDIAVSSSNIFAVGDPGDPDQMIFNGGAVQVIYGSADGPATTAPANFPTTSGEGFTIYTSEDPSDQDRFGREIAGVGDVNGDGIDDMLISAPIGNGSGTGPDNSGETFLLLGRDTDGGDAAFEDFIDIGSLSASDFSANLYRFSGISEDDESGWSIAEAGDFNNDGITDFLIGAHEADNEDLGFGSRAGETYVIYGGAASLEAADNADGTDDNNINLANIDVDVVTGAVDTEISLQDNFGFEASQLEGSTGTTIFSFTAVRDGDLSRTVSFDYAVTGFGFAAADADDFGGTLPSGTVTFAAGSSTARIDVEVSGDLTIENNETFQVDISNPVGSGLGAVSIANSTATGVILTDDVPPAILVSGAGTLEGNAGDTNTLTFTISRQGDLVDGVEVSYDLTASFGEGSFFSADSADIVGTLPSFDNTVTFAAGQSSIDVTVQVVGDAIIEPRESIDLTVTGVTAPDGIVYATPTSPARGTITNDDGRPPEIPPGIESDVFGDPHIVSLDGLSYDFQAVGEYILVETVPGAADPFQVQVRFEPVEGSDLASQTTRMAVQVGGKTVEIDANTSPALIVDGVPTTLDPATLSLDLDGDGNADIYSDGVDYTIILNDANEQLKVGVADGLINVCVFLSDAVGGNAGMVQGLMGNGDGNLSNDFQLRDGSTVPVDAITLEDDGDGNMVPRLSFDFLYGRGDYDGDGYAQSWELSGDAGDNNGFFTGDAVLFPADFPSASINLADLPAGVRALAEQAALDSGLDPAIVGRAVFEAAVLDFALTGDAQFFDIAGGLAAEPIADSDPTGAPSLPAAFGILPGSQSISEGDTGTTSISFVVYRAGDTSLETVVDYAVGGDVDADDLAAGTALTGSVTFAAGETEQTITIEVAGDIANESDETVAVTITGTDDGSALIANESTSTLVVNDDVNNAPTVALSLEDQDGTEDTDVNFTLPAGSFTDLDGDALTLSATLVSGAALPLWLAFDAAAGTFSATPPLDFNGTLDIRVTASDGTEEVSDDFVLDIAAANDAPILVNSLDDQNGTEDTDVSFVLPADAFSDVDGDILILTATSLEEVTNGTNTGLLEGPLPSWLSFSATSRTFSGTPPLNFNGELQIRVTASDGELDVSSDFVLDIAPGNDEPEAVADSGFEVTENASISITAADLLTNDMDVDGDVLTIASVGNASNGTVELIDGNVLFTPDTDYNGPATFDYTISDGALDSTATVSLDVLEDVMAEDPYVDYQQGTDGNDRIFGTFFQANQIFGADGNDRIYGGIRSDDLAGGDGNDKLYGLFGDDLLEGNDGNDRLFGSLGDDILVGGEGDDRLDGGWGSDTFVFGEGDGRDRIVDFSSGHQGWFWSVPGDNIQIEIDGIDSFADLMATGIQRGANAIFRFDDGDALVVRNTDLSSFDENDFTIM